MDDEQIANDALLAKLTFAPEPSITERDAVVAALNVLLALRGQAGREDVIETEAEPWLVAGRRESVRGLGGGPLVGWGKSHRGSSL